MKKQSESNGGACRRSYFWVTLALTTFTPGYVLAQTQAHVRPIRGKLAVVETVSLGSFPDQGTLVPIKSDPEGNMYVRFYQPDIGKAPIIKIGDDGSELARFTLASIPTQAMEDEKERDAAFTDDFSVCRSGDLYELVGVAPKTYLVEFSLKGQYEGMTQLETKEPEAFLQLTCLAGDRFFVTGTTLGIPNARRPVNAIFSGSGQLLAEVSLQGDVRAVKGEKGASQAENPIAQAVGMGTTLAGDDGMVYLMRAVSPAQVFVIGADGQMVRKLTVQTPIVGGTPETFKLHAGKLAVMFTKAVPSVKGNQPDEIVVRVVDATSGAVLGDYEGGVETSRWAGYNDDGFLFLGAKDKKLTRVRAVLQ